jgi:flagellar biosynthesis activator protein FlaF
MSFQAYQSAAQRAESPRGVEYRLFAEVTRSLMDFDRMDPAEVGKRMEALEWNRRMWATLAGDCAAPDNKLPDALRANIISLYLFVERHTPKVWSGEEPVSTLVEVNRAIMQGLMPPERAAAA